MKCIKCGKRINKKFKLCPICGTKVEIKNEVYKGNKKLKFIVSGVLLLSLVVLCLMFFNSKADFDDLKKSVVLINVYNSDNELISTGSGVVAFENDIILTNAHVIEDNYKIEVISENNTKYQVDGILDYNKKKDMAILKLTSSKGLKKVELGSNIKIGKDVTAIGSPLGLKNTISTGIISGNFQDNIEVYQHTAPISSGSSGGALFDSNGKLIGITYASIKGGQNLNLAIPIKHYKKEYDIVKNNDVIDSKYYYLLNSQITRTKSGIKLIQYILNDKFKNSKSPKSEDFDEAQKGHLYYIFNSLDKNSDVAKYIKSSVSITSGVLNSIDMINSKDNDTSIIDGSYYTVIIVKTNLSNNKSNEKIVNYIKNEYESFYNIKEGNYITKIGKNYIYALECKNYDDCDGVKRILNELVND